MEEKASYVEASYEKALIEIAVTGLLVSEGDADASGDSHHFALFVHQLQRTDGVPNRHRADLAAFQTNHPAKLLLMNQVDRSSAVAC